MTRNEKIIYSLKLPVIVFGLDLNKIIYHIKLLNETRVINRHLLTDHFIRP